MDRSKIAANNSFFLVRINFILSVMIVWHHAYNIETFNLIGINTLIAKVLIQIENFFSILQLVAVPIFFIISGYLFYINYSWKKVVDKYKTRIKSVLIPYIIWNAIVYIFYFLLTHINSIKDYMSMKQIELSWYSIYRNIVCCDINSSMWFIRSLIDLIAFSPLFFIALNKNKVISWILVLLSFAIYIIFPIGQHTTLFSLQFFLLGGLLARYYPEKLFFPVKKREGILAFLLLVIIICIYIINNLFDYHRIRSILLLIEALLFWISIRSLQCLSSTDNPPWFFEISFFIYCMHGIVLESIEKLIYIIGGKTVAFAYIDYFIAPILSICIIIICAKFLSERCILVWNILNGYRQKRGRLQCH